MEGVQREKQSRNARQVVKGVSGNLVDIKKRLRAEFMNELKGVAPSGEEERGGKFQRTGMISHRSASADGCAPRKQAVLLGFPQELMQATIQRTAEALGRRLGIHALHQRSKHLTSHAR